MLHRFGRRPTFGAGFVSRRQVAIGLAAMGLAPLGGLRIPTARAASLTAADVKNAKGPLNILGSQPYETRPSWPSELNISWAYNTTNEEILTKTTQPGTFDMVIIYQGEIDQLRKLDRIEPIDTGLLENWNKVAPLFRDSDVIRRDGKVFAVPFHWGHGYVEYNADEVQPPKSYDDLLSPKLTKKIGLPDDPYAVITTFAFFAGAEKPNNLSRAEFDKTIKLLKSFRPQVLTIHNYGDEVALFARKDIWVGFPEYSDSLMQSRKAGATNVQATMLAAWSYVDCFMVLKAAEHPAAAYKFIDIALGTESQKLTTQHSMAFPVNDEAIPAIAKELQYSSSADVLKKAPLVPGVTVEEGGRDVPFQEWVQAWEEFKAS
ncbi:MAG: extracellular solute-binding protein [Bradyrhizobium sp.]|uniref:ABC transporter substrate-binding protein n=1 Tax=Bradyrhizobium sp. TaxID=376 RepID=UPI001D56F5E3|nr:extracellular solute-binding protein [Bradyrhizobium sp.]MBV9560450.1 extracellular solute-binding protein [Bradyrhizobium sp.]